MQKIESKIRKSTKEHPGYNITKNSAGEESDLSGQLSHVSVSTKHANGPEKKIKAVRDGHDAGMNSAIPVIGEADQDGK
jgi:hypothetical protein